MSERGRVFPFPIGIVAFNRPEHVAKLATQLLEQTVRIDPSLVFVNVDGFVGSLDDERGQADRRSDNRAILQQRLPGARLFEQDGNRGVAACIFELERWMMSDTDAPWVVVLEEDIDQAPDHLEQVLGLIERFDAVADVAMVTATGERAIEASRGADAVYPAVGSRAYAIRRTYFERKRPFVEAYLAAIARKRYDRLEYRDVARQLADLGVVSVAPNQDFVSFALLQRLDALYVTTARRHVRHVGVRGMHFQGSGSVDHDLFGTSRGIAGAEPYRTPGFAVADSEGSIDTELAVLRAESRAAFAREIADQLLRMHSHPEDYLRLSDLVHRIPRRLLLALRRRALMLRSRIDVRLRRR